jgi:serine/threonine-protein kinase RsbW/sigma-B regulation protein RsbU (phosphoserine phosphatase)
MQATFQQTLWRNKDNSTPVTDEVERFCAEQGLPSAVGFKVRLVLEELVLNLMDHAVGSATGRIDVRIDLEPGRVILVLEDDGNPFDPRSVPAFDKDRPLEERGPRGMGIHLVRTMAEEIAYVRIDGRNQLRVVLQR